MKTVQQCYNVRVLGKSVCNFPVQYFQSKSGKIVCFQFIPQMSGMERKTAKSPEDSDRVIDNCQHIIPFCDKVLNLQEHVVRTNISD